MRFLSKNGWFFIIDGKAIGEKSAVSRTWYLNDTIDGSTYVSFDANFVSNGEYFRCIQCIGLPELSYYYYNSSSSAGPYSQGVWQQPEYRTITFDEPPSGDLLTWLQANGIPRGGTGVIERLTMISSAQAQVQNMTDGIVDAALKLQTAIDGVAAGIDNGEMSGSLSLQSAAFGKNIVVNRRQIKELLQLTTPGPQTEILALVDSAAGEDLTMGTTIPAADALTFLPIDAGEDLTMGTTIPAADALTFLPIDAGDAVTLTTPVPSAVAADGIDTVVEQGLSISSTAQPETLTIADGQSTGQLQVEMQAQPEALALAEALATAGLTLEHKAVGAAIGWLYPEKYGDLLLIRQVYSTAVKQDGVLGRILEVT